MQLGTIIVLSLDFGTVNKYLNWPFNAAAKPPSLGGNIALTRLQFLTLGFWGRHNSDLTEMEDIEIDTRWWWGGGHSGVTPIFPHILYFSCCAHMHDVQSYQKEFL